MPNPEESPKEQITPNPEEDPKGQVDPQEGEEPKGEQPKPEETPKGKESDPKGDHAEDPAKKETPKPEGEKPEGEPKPETPQKLVLQDKSGKEEEWDEARVKGMQAENTRLQQTLAEIKKGSEQNQTNQAIVKTLLEGLEEVDPNSHKLIEGLLNLDEEALAKLPTKTQVAIAKIKDKMEEQQTAEAGRRKEATQKFIEICSKEAKELKEKPENFPGLDFAELDRFIQDNLLFDAGITPVESYFMLYGPKLAEAHTQQIEDLKAGFEKEKEEYAAQQVEDFVVKYGGSLEKWREATKATTPPADTGEREKEEKIEGKTALERTISRIKSRKGRLVPTA
jgi:hypothetical protein